MEGGGGRGEERIEGFTVNCISSCQAQKVTETEILLLYNSYLFLSGIRLKREILCLKFN